MVESVPMNRRVARTGQSATMSLARLRSTGEVTAARTAVNSWPLAGAAAFLNQATSDGEISDAMHVLKAARLAALELVRVRANSQSAAPTEAARLAALDVLLEGAGDCGSNLLQTYTDACFTLGMLYGLRLANLGGAR